MAVVHKRHRNATVVVVDSFPHACRCQLDSRLLLPLAPALYDEVVWLSVSALCSFKTASNKTSKKNILTDRLQDWTAAVIPRLSAPIDRKYREETQACQLTYEYGCRGYEWMGQHGWWCVTSGGPNSLTTTRRYVFPDDMAAVTTETECELMRLWG